MQANLIFNPNARSSGNVDPENLISKLRKVGYEPVYQATSSEADLDRVLAEAEGLVVVAGGDGSVRAVVTRILAEDLPMTILPLGTANNIANSLEISGLPDEIIAGLAKPSVQDLDIGYVSSPRGEDYFLESAGYGLFAKILESYGPKQGKSIIRGIESISAALANYQSKFRQLEVDGQDVSGSYLIVEALNTPTIGPRVPLAPKAEVDDGQFDLVQVHEDQRSGLVDYLSRLVTGRLEELPGVEIIRGERLELEWTGFPFHVDAEVRPKQSKYSHEDKWEGHGSINSEILIEMRPKALEIWLPEIVES